MSFEIRRPPARRHTTRAFIEFLEANPNTWARFDTYKSYDSAAYRRKAARKAYGHLGFEFVTRREADGVSVFGRKLAPELAHLLAG